MSVKEHDLWSFWPATADGLTKGLLVFANGQTIQLTEMLVAESPWSQSRGPVATGLPSNRS
jgi:hypothetical protein